MRSLTRLSKLPGMACVWLALFLAGALATMFGAANAAGVFVPASARAATASASAGWPQPGVLTPRLAATTYRAEIVPIYPAAVRLADALAYDKPAAAAQAAAFSTGLSKTLASLNGVTAFPGKANGPFTAYRAQARALRAMLAHPAAVTSSVTARRQAALALYALARQIGQLGTALNLVLATESGGKN
jgi:hypothetical protein